MKLLNLTLLLLTAICMSCEDNRPCHELVEDHGIDGEEIIPHRVTWVNDNKDTNKIGMTLYPGIHSNFIYDTLSFDKKAGTFKHKFRYNWFKYFYDTITVGVDEGYFELIESDDRNKDYEYLFCEHRDSIVFWGEGIPRQAFWIRRYCNQLTYIFRMPTKHHGTFEYYVDQADCFELR